MRLRVSPTFSRAMKKLSPAWKADLDDAVRAIAADPAIGEAKVGDLAGVRVFKARLGRVLHLIAYTWTDEETITLLAVGPHENFYRDLKR